jgi:hypothetical protein
MANPTTAERMNRPVWNNSTTATAVALTGGFDAVSTAGYYVIISNVGANTVYVGPSNATPGILLQPGASFETAIIPGSALYVQGTAAQPVSVVQYVGE